MNKKPVPIGRALSPSEERRFWSKVQRGHGNSCWLWSGGMASNGYGRISLGGRSGRYYLAHRIAFYLAKGSEPDVVMHECDVRLCCNPAHLSPGTISENNADCLSKGRFRGRGVPGRENGRARLTEGSVVEIRRRRSRGETICSIARDFGISHTTVSRIARRDSWACLDEGPECPDFSRQTGERHWNSKLTEGDALAILDRLLNGSTQREIASEFGVSQAAVSDIACGRKWKHLHKKPLRMRLQREEGHASPARQVPVGEEVTS